MITDEFRSKVACENEVIQLTCNPFSRIAIYSASYGRTEYESIQCTQPQGVKEESKYYGGCWGDRWCCGKQTLHIFVHI